MPVDFNKIKNARSDAELVVLDSVALNKSWSKTPSYWIEILKNEASSSWFVQKRWSFFSKSDNEQINGSSPGRSIQTEKAAVEKYGELIQEKLGADYLIAGRMIDPKSPCADQTFDNQGDDYTDGRDSATDLESPEEPEWLSGRKPQYDLSW